MLVIRLLPYLETVLIVGLLAFILSLPFITLYLLYEGVSYLRNTRKAVAEEGNADGSD